MKKENNMEYMGYRAFCTKQGKDITLCTFWIDDNGNIDEENLPSKKPIVELLQALRLYDVSVEFTGMVEDEE